GLVSSAGRLPPVRGDPVSTVDASPAKVNALPSRTGIALIHFFRFLQGGKRSKPDRPTRAPP
ncbi:hypothetical protein ACFQ1S_03540, partial [Kibdelosporangium lantanae]